ncbi:MAG: hypothetical protein M3328_08255, partial [Chloroflexota bacterium]|nr:hypothetical protein [Chloroflexota bacterium]
MSAKSAISPARLRQRRAAGPCSPHSARGQSAVARCSYYSYTERSLSRTSEFSSRSVESTNWLAA